MEHEIEWKKGDEVVLGSLNFVTAKLRIREVGDNFAVREFRVMVLFFE